MFSSLDGLFILPVCYHQTTVLSVDDDPLFLEAFASEVSDRVPLLCFDSPEKATEFTKKLHRHYPFTDRCILSEGNTFTFDFKAIRNEIYNADRFKEIFMVVTDYDMPHQDGIDLIRNIEFSPEVSQYAHIILTGKISKEFKEKLKGLGLSQEYIGKDDPDYIEKLLALVEKRLKKIFQWYSYVPARILSQDPNENSFFLFDKNFGKILNKHIKNNKISELYLFDKQGSYLFLDQDANLSWLFVRNATGIENSIKMATQYGAPKAVIDALKSKEVILSLYEKEDFERLNHSIDWDSYLLPAVVFEAEETSLNFFKNLIPQSYKDNQIPLQYFYAFSKSFPNHGIERKKILSYNEFLQGI
jgi:CheY-like chemotaxis protein